MDVSGYPNVTEVRYSLFKREPAQVRIVVELNNVKNVQYSQNVIADKLIIDLNVAGDNVTPAPVTPVGDSGRKVVVMIQDTVAVIQGRSASRTNPKRNTIWH